MPLRHVPDVPFCCFSAIRAALLIQRWYRQYVARLEMRRRCTWNIFQSIEYAGEQDQIKLYHFFGFLMDHFTPASSERNLISHIFRENEVCRDADWERYFCYKDIEVPDSYCGPHLAFPMTFCGVSKLMEAFKLKQQLHARYVLQILGETWRLLRILPNINHVSVCHTKEITICGDLHGQLEDLLLIFYKNGLPSCEKPYVFNGDFVDRGKNSLEILLILFGFLLVYPNEVHLNRGNHEDHIVNLRYGFTKEVLGKYRVHGKKILKLLQKIFSWLPLATVINHKVLVVHGGISDSTDLDMVARMDRHRVREASSSSQIRVPPPPGALADQHLGPGSEEQHPASLPPQPAHRRRPAELLGGGRAEGEAQAGWVRSDLQRSEDIVNLLWSDPMPQNGCISNEVRGGGCYWGPDVTEEVLGKHNLQLLIRSHECKQDGYEFCHNRRVLTIFSASNYYEVGSNRGYQASRTCRELTLRQRSTRSALRALRQQLFVHKSDLVGAFQEFDPNNTGVISLRHWATATERVLKLGLPWRVLRPQLINRAQHGMVDYQQWIRELSITDIMETMYKNHSNLETIFRIIDTDHSGLISFEEFRQTWKLLSSHLKMEISDKAITDLAQSMDFNKDGSIDINEFMEAFRLVDLSTHA
uniref:Serine/threonine-protein phosphatase with EF-hands n=1 Tax=Poecilia latipinna TaxID=48699 RepID=A0A3B3VL98_9TELE